MLVLFVVSKDDIELHWGWVKVLVWQYGVSVRTQSPSVTLNFLISLSLSPPACNSKLLLTLGPHFTFSLQFFFTEKDVGRNCAEVSMPRLAELNSYVRVEVLSGPLTNEVVGAFQVVVLTQSSLDEQHRIGDFCHSKNIKFIVASTRGLFGSVERYP